MLGVFAVHVNLRHGWLTIVVALQLHIRIHLSNQLSVQLHPLSSVQPNRAF